MTYLTDNPWPLILVLAAVAVVCFLSGSAKARGIAGVCLLLCVGVFFLERFLISPREEVEDTVELLLQEFKDADIEGIASLLSANSKGLKDTTAQGLELVKVEDSFHLGSLNVTLNDDEQSAIAMVRANGNLKLLKHGGGVRHVATYWKMTWIREQNDWLLDKVVRLDPVNGQEIGILSAK